MPARAPSAFDEMLAEIEADFSLWLATLFPSFVTAPFAEHHIEFWEHVWSIRPYVKPPAFIGVWPRGGGKSSSAEMAVVALGARGIRRYVLWISETQDQADDHVANIGGLLESVEVATFYPALATRRLGKYGNVKSWRRNRLWTAAGFVVDAIGLDTAARGLKLEAQRPDAIFFDDLDQDIDTVATTARKIKLLTKKLLPTGSGDAAVVGVQNLVHDDGIFARLSDGRADFLANRVVSGPIPAAYDLVYQPHPDEPGRWLVTGGEPTWEGQNLAVIQQNIDDWGLSQFLSEGQHETQPPAGGMFDHIEFAAIQVRPEDVPPLERVSCWVDPAVTDTDRSDSQAFQVDGLGIDGLIYRLHSWERRASPLVALKNAIRKAAEFGATKVGVETDQGGDTWLSVFREAQRAVVDDLETEILAMAEMGEGQAVEELTRLLEAVNSMGFAEDKAGAGHGPKAARAQRMLAWGYERSIGGRGVLFRHVLGTHLTLERALHRFPVQKPFDLCLVGSTQVLTEQGPMAIRDVRVQQRVMTRQGWQPVTAAGMTRRDAPVLRLIHGAGCLVGTANHPIWTQRGWVPLGELTPSDSVGLWNGKPSARLPDASGRPRREVCACCTTSGNGGSPKAFNPEDRSPASSVAVIVERTGVGSASPIGIGGGGTGTHSLEDRDGQGLRSMRTSSSLGFDTGAIRTPHNGRGTISTVRSTDQPMGRFRTGWTFTTWTRTRSTTRRPISPSSREASIGPSMDQLGSITKRCWTTLQPFVRRLLRGIAVKRDGLGTENTGHVSWQRVMRVEPAGTADVYDLTVANAHEFVADGVLVHNCDAAYYSFHDLAPAQAGTGSGAYSGGQWRRPGT